MTAENMSSIPLWLLYDDEIDAWRAARSPFIKSWLSEHNFKGEKHRVLLMPDSNGGLEMAVGGLGKRQGGLSLWHAAGFAERLPARRFRLAQPWSDAEATQLSLGFVYGAYRFERYRPGKAERAASVEAPANADQHFVAMAAESLKMARDLINTPAGDMGPVELAAAARQLADRHRADYREWVGEDLLTAKFPAIHAVGRASASAPRLVDIRWSPRDGENLPRLTLVGKGVCFDTGGLDIKPSSGMALMKKDMGGAAVALSLANMLMRAKIGARLRVLVPAVENSIGGNAYRPGDVLETRKGLTVEVGNTDAEGRLVLCDALALADSERPDLIIDFATLTGAARVALGPELPALFGSDETMVNDLARIAAAEHDPLWPMPLWTGYDDELGSKIADLNNVAPSGFAGAIFGALFLKRFVTETPNWMHIDLYGWNPKERPGRGVGAEAHAVRGVYRYLAERYGVGSDT
ncbi:MAG TPA: leucyl aminopeptidase family protein [Steroidobacteraceae bacterium]|jgi:leucyl aminopeptidase|nr:leucyl aminopeptidase family protein [Steroidobacteraceae bacterium]